MKAKLESLTTWGLLHLLSRRDVPESVFAALAAVVSLVANLDEAVQLQRLPPVSWGNVQAALPKPGGLLNSLRLFPSLAASRSVPEANVAAAKAVLQGATAEALAEEQVALVLFCWVQAALEFYSVHNEASGRRRASAKASAKAADSQSSQRPKLTEASVGRTSAGRRPQTSLGGRSSGSSSPPSTPVQASSPVLQARRSVPGAGPLAASAAMARRGPGGAYARPEPVNPRGTVLAVPAVAAAASPLPAAIERSRASFSSIGQPSSVRGGGGYPRQNTEVVKQQIEQLQRETRNLRVSQSHLKWSMKREETKSKRLERKEELDDVQVWRAEQVRAALQYEAERKEAALKAELEENRDFQEFKRAVREERHDTDVQLSREVYENTKENSEYSAKVIVAAHLENQKLACSANLEQIRDVTEFKAEEKRKEKVDYRENHNLQDILDANFQLRQVQAERDTVWQSLEHLRDHQNDLVPKGLTPAFK